MQCTTSSQLPLFSFLPQKQIIVHHWCILVHLESSSKAQSFLAQADCLINVQSVAAPQMYMHWARGGLDILSLGGSSLATVFGVYTGENGGNLISYVTGQQPEANSL